MCFANVACQRRSFSAPLNDLDADAIGCRDITDGIAGCKFPGFDQECDASLSDLFAIFKQVPLVAETKMVGAPFIMAGISFKLFHAPGNDWIFSGTLTADENIDTAETDGDLGCIAQLIFALDGGAKFIDVPFCGNARLLADNMDVIE